MPDIFDQLSSETKPQQSQGDIFDQLSQETSKTQSLLSAFPKGLLKSIEDVTSLGFKPSGPISSQLRDKLLEQFLPTRPETGEKILETAGKLAPLAATSGEGAIPSAIRTGIAAIGSEQLQEAGAPEWARNLFELATFMTPRLQKGLSPTKIQKEAVDFLKSKGLTDKEITPLIQSEKKLRMLSPLARKGASTKKALEGSKEKLGSAFDYIKQAGSNLEMRPADQHIFMDEFRGELDKISPRFRRLIDKEVESLLGKPVTFKSLVDFNQDVNAIVKGQEGGKAVLNILKDPVKQAMKRIDPALAKEQDTLNRMYARQKAVSKKLSPKITDDILKAGEIGSLAIGFGTLNPSILLSVAGESAVREMMQQILTNPRLQNLSLQTYKAISKNKIPIAIKLAEEMKRELEESNPNLFGK